MDNWHVDVMSAGKEQLALALSLLSNGMPMTAYLEEDGQIVLLWEPGPGSKELLYPLLTVEQMTEFVWGWLEHKAEHRGRYADEGGDVKNEKGAWRAWCGPWGRDDQHSFGFARVEARYAWIGK